jgi:hypothetical protein
LPVDYEFDSVARVVRVTARGAVAAAEIQACYEALALEPWMAPGLGFIVDTRLATSIPGLEQLRTAADASLRAATIIGNAHIAFVVPHAALFGVVRQFSSLTERSGADIRPFYSAADAEAWLQSPGDDQ